MFEQQFKYKFEAAHRFTKSCTFSCATPHGHTWYATALVIGKETKLGDDDMLVEFQKVKKNWKILLDEVFDHSWMGNLYDPLLPALREHIPHLRFIPFPCDPTTEVIAVLLFHKMQQFIKEAGLEEIITLARVDVDETPTNRVSFTAGEELVSKNGEFQGHTGWWGSQDPYDRTIVKL